MFSRTQMSQDLARLRDFVAAFHNNERGDNENLGRLLLLALVLVPLILLIAFFGDDIYKTAKAQWTKVTGTKVGS